MAAAVRQAKRRPMVSVARIVAPQRRLAGMREMLERQAEALVRNGTGVVAGESEAIHQFRIRIRMLRGLIELYRPMLRQDWSNRHREELRFLGNSVGALRDTDVLRQNLSDTAVKLDDSLRDALGLLYDSLAERRHEQHEKVIALLRSPRYDALLRSIPRPAIKQPRSPENTAAELIQPLVRAVKRAGTRLSGASSPAEFHRLRIRIKRLRYALEMLGNGKSKRAKRVARKLKSVQDLLGLQRDLITAMSWLREVAASATVGGPALLAAGAVYEVLHRRMLKLSRQVWEESKTVRTGSLLQDVLSAVPDSIPKTRTDRVDSA